MFYYFVNSKKRNKCIHNDEIFVDLYYEICLFQLYVEKSSVKRILTNILQIIIKENIFKNTKDIITVILHHY